MGGAILWPLPHCSAATLDELLPGAAVRDGGGEFGLEFGGDLGVAFDDVDLLTGVVGEVVELVFGDLGVREGLLNLDIAGRFFSVVGELPVAGTVAVVSFSAVCPAG